jgi:hypothetical protein
MKIYANYMHYNRQVTTEGSDAGSVTHFRFCKCNCLSEATPKLLSASVPCIDSVYQETTEGMLENPAL